MAATTEGAIKARLESLGFGVPAFRDGPRPGQDPPYIVIEQQDIVINRASSGDFGDPTAEVNVTEILTVDLIELARIKVGPTTTRNAQRYGLAEAIAHALHGRPLSGAPTPVTAVKATDIDRFPIADNRVRSSITVEVHRPLQTSEVTPA